jgi:hypothetical protein
MHAVNENSSFASTAVKDYHGCIGDAPCLGLVPKRQLLLDEPCQGRKRLDPDRACLGIVICGFRKL